MSRSSVNGSSNPSLLDPRIPPRVQLTDVQPSWTGPDPRSRSATSTERVQRWLCQDDRCVPYREENFTDNINWRIFRIMAEFVEGFDFLSQLHHEVTFFGSARAHAGHPHYELARELATLCAKSGYTVITGGGPGIMEAANRGAHEAGGESVGIDINLPNGQRRNQYVRKAIAFNYFFTRKVMLSASAQAYVFFPGGYGTLDELFEMITLIQTRKMSVQVPVILMNKEFWKPLVAWLKQMLLTECQYIEKEDLLLLHVVDTPEEAFELIKKTHERVL